MLRVSNVALLFKYRIYPLEYCIPARVNCVKSQSVPLKNLANHVRLRCVQKKKLCVTVRLSSDLQGAGDIPVLHVD